MSDELKEMFEELRDFDLLSTYQNFIDELEAKVEEELKRSRQTELEELEAKIKPFTKDRINPHCYDVGFVNGALECLWGLQKRIKELSND